MYLLIIGAGQPGWYESFVQRLGERLPRATGAKWRITVIGLRGHVSAATRKKAGFMDSVRGNLVQHGLNAQVDHISDYVRDDTSESDNRERTIVLGHSIGAYFGLEAMRRYPDKVHAFVGLMVRC
jgi:pimeloyl-ACP methyl ester carboxylesterase